MMLKTAGQIIDEVAESVRLVLGTEVGNALATYIRAVQMAAYKAGWQDREDGFFVEAACIMPEGSVVRDDPPT